MVETRSRHQGLDQLSWKLLSQKKTVRKTTKVIMTPFKIEDSFPVCPDERLLIFHQEKNEATIIMQALLRTTHSNNSKKKTEEQVHF